MAFFQAQMRERDRQIAEKKEWERSLALKTPLPISPKKKRFMIVNPDGTEQKKGGGDKGPPRKYATFEDL